MSLSSSSGGLIANRPGSRLVLERIRNRIHHARYFGVCVPGDRLPSIRDTANAEQVNRKTVAAAYLRLEDEGLVEIRARSGIYLSALRRPESTGPLEKLQLSWLEQMYLGARALGLDTGRILEVVTEIAAVERSRFPVVASTFVEASGLARELHAKLSVHAIPIAASELDTAPALLADAPLVLCTPWYAAAAARANGGAAVIPVTLSEELVAALQGPNEGMRLVIAPDEAVAAQIREGLRLFKWESRARTVVVAAADAREESLKRFRFQRILIWPGADASRLDGAGVSLEPVSRMQLLSRRTLELTQRAVLEEALRRLARKKASIQ